MEFPNIISQFLIQCKSVYPLGTEPVEDKGRLLVYFLFILHLHHRNNKQRHASLRDLTFIIISHRLH